ncbi:MAG TPA: endo-1,4-beta-xylanase [Gemmatimonadales bacterium]|nr:endo-1,4-beta-xylanase [Gemmatimonadales bacterium]
MGTRHLVLVLGALGTACGGPTAALPGYAPDVVVSPRRATLVPGSTIGLTAIGPTHAINWTSLNRGVATVDSFGTVRAVALGVAMIVAAGGNSGKLADTATVAVDPPLRSLASVHHLLVGVAVDMNAFHSDAHYSQTLAAEYSSVTPEWIMKFGSIHPGPNQYSFADPDSLVSFALTHGMVVHGHTLVWGAALPAWVSGGTFTRDQLLKVLGDHIATVVGRYRGKVASWDVVNEVVGDTTPLRNTLWLQVIGPAYIDSAFVWAHRADPGAKLYLNETHAEGINAKSTATLTLVQALRARGIPIDGVGFQAHFALTPPPPTAADLAANLARFVSAGFDVRVSEMDVRIADSAQASALDQQAAIYHDMLDACLRVSPHCTAFTTWGFTDRHSWIPKFYPGYGRALPFDGTYQSKPAYTALLTRLQQP